MQGKIKHEFSAKIWQYTGPNGWYFVSLPIAIASEIRQNLKWQEEGWGRMKAHAQIGLSQWATAIWFDKKQNTYLLLLKSAIRKQENLKVAEDVKILLFI